MIQLYDLAGHDPDLRFSPYCWRIRLALAHKGLEAETIPWRFHEKALLPGAPRHQKVPVLVDGGTVLAESADIAAYLDSHYENRPGLFGGETAAAHARFVAAWSDTVLIPRLAPVLVPYVLPLLHPLDQGYFRETRELRLGATVDELRARRQTLLDEARATLTPLRATLARQDFLGGKEPSYADYAVFSCLQWARCVGAPELIVDGDQLRPWQGEMLNLFDGLALAARSAGEPGQHLAQTVGQHQE
jgi:glutathione S-transferase